MHAIHEKLLVEQSVAPDRMEIRLSIDQDAAVSPGDVSVDVLKLRQASHRIAIKIPGCDVLAISLFKCPGSLQELGQSVVGLGEAGLFGDQVTIAGQGALGVGGLLAAYRQELSREGIANTPGRRRRQERAVGFVRGIVGGRQDQDRHGPDPFGIRDECLQASAEVEQERGVL